MLAPCLNQTTTERFLRFIAHKKSMITGSWTFETYCDRIYEDEVNWPATLPETKETEYLTDLGIIEDIMFP
jgi:hypothetical protein